MMPDAPAHDDVSVPGKISDLCRCKLLLQGLDLLSCRLQLQSPNVTEWYLRGGDPPRRVCRAQDAGGAAGKARCTLRCKAAGIDTSWQLQQCRHWISFEGADAEGVEGSDATNVYAKDLRVLLSARQRGGSEGAH